jgi:energy-coupling factor transporter ATP-binding protein EcfA2
MEVRFVKTKFAEIRFSGRNLLGSNKVDLLTGRNGSGKTKVLTALAELSHPEKMSSDLRIVWAEGGRSFDNYRQGSDYARPPRRVIAQTFSPFTLRENVPRGWICVQILNLMRTGSVRTSMSAIV